MYRKICRYEVSKQRVFLCQMDRSNIIFESLADFLLLDINPCCLGWFSKKCLLGVSEVSTILAM